MKVGVFLHGTAIMHAAAAGVDRDERVRQVRRGDPTVRNLASYIPAPGTLEKLAAWHRHGAVLVYLSSHRRPDDIRANEQVVRRRGFRPARCTAASRARTTGRSWNGSGSISWSKTTAKASAEPHRPAPPG